MSFITSPGVVGFTNQQNTAVPNNVVPVSFFLGSSGTAAAVDVAFQPKGNGSILGQIPDNTNAGGNKRGQQVVDLQQNRAHPGGVALGNFSVIAGGRDNENDGTQGALVGGLSNTVTAAGNNGFIGGGQSNTVSNRAVVCGGFTNIASASDSGILSGNNCVASGIASQAGGQFATTRGIHGAVAYASNQIFTLGDMQRCSYGLGFHTNNAVLTELTANQAGASASNTVALPDNAVYKFRVEVAGYADVAQDFLVVEYEGVVSRAVGAATAVITGLITTPIAVTGGAAAWLTGVTADVAVGGLAVNVTGAAGIGIKWNATVTTTELTR